MSPLEFWMLIIISSIIFHTGKYFVVGSFDFDGAFSGIYWAGFSMAAIHYGWIKP